MSFHQDGLPMSHQHSFLVNRAEVSHPYLLQFPLPQPRKVESAKLFLALEMAKVNLQAFFHLGSERMHHMELVVLLNQNQEFGRSYHWKEIQDRAPSHEEILIADRILEL